MLLALLELLKLFFWYEMTWYGFGSSAVLDIPLFCLQQRLNAESMCMRVFFNTYEYANLAQPSEINPKMNNS